MISELLPIDKVLPELHSALLQNSNVVLSAEPGAGKTTRVPISLLRLPWRNNKKILMLEPRRLAAIRAAEFMSIQMNEKVGQTIGYRTRGETKISDSTIIEVITEGILTRMLQSDQSLSGVACIIFDEFHERNIHTDVGLAFTLDIQEHLNPDVRILVMSATLDCEAVSNLLGKAPIIKSEGRNYPVAVNYFSQPILSNLENEIVLKIQRSLREDEGDILVFLPGQREINKIESLLEQKKFPDVIVTKLFGEASKESQRAALSNVPKEKRKVILSTSIAETSLTIEGVRVVIDSGLARTARFDPRRGMSGLVTIPVTKATAEQRKGRAGRQSAGVCYRMWTEIQHAQLREFPQPEIMAADLAPSMLEMAKWGDSFFKNLKFLNIPPEAHIQQAFELLKNLNAIDEKGQLTKHGKAMSEIPAHPRFAHMLIKAQQLQLVSLACDVAALLEERDFLRGKEDFEIDFYYRWLAFHESKIPDKNIFERIRLQSERYHLLMNCKRINHLPEKLGLLIALAYPERIAKRKNESDNKYQLANSSVGILPKQSQLLNDEYLAIAEVDGAGSDVKIFLAASLSQNEIESNFSENIISKTETIWDEKTEAVVTREIRSLGAVQLSVKNIPSENEKTKKILLNVISEKGLQILPFTENAELFRFRSEWVRNNSLAQDFPDLSGEFLIKNLADWLSPFIDNLNRKSQLQQLNLLEIFKSLFTYEQLQILDKLAPTHIIAPTGSRIKIDYTNSPPIVAVRLQEMFGETETPSVANGKIKVLLHLLSPANRPIAITQDLPNFWKNVYSDVRKDMRGQYPKHYWPENPLEAEPTKRTKKFMNK